MGGIDEVKVERAIRILYPKVRKHIVYMCVCVCVLQCYCSVTATDLLDIPRQMTWHDCTG